MVDAIDWVVACPFVAADHMGNYYYGLSKLIGATYTPSFR